MELDENKNLSDEELKTDLKDYYYRLDFLKGRYKEIRGEEFIEEPEIEPRLTSKEF